MSPLPSGTGSAAPFRISECETLPTRRKKHRLLVLAFPIIAPLAHY